MYKLPTLELKVQKFAPDVFADNFGISVLSQMTLTAIFWSKIDKNNAFKNGAFEIL